LFLSANTNNRRTEAAGDFGITVHLTNSLLLIDSFRVYNWRIPSFGSLVAVGSTTAACTIGTTALSSCIVPQFLKRSGTENQVEFEYAMRHGLGVRFGYRYSNTFIFEQEEVFPSVTEGPPPTGEVESGVDNGRITGNTGVAGVWYRPSQKFRFNVDGEITANRISTGGDATGIPANTTFGLGLWPRITPRHEQQVRAKVTATPERWAVLSGNFSWNQQINNLFSLNYNMRLYTGGASVMLIPSSKSTFDVAYNYSNYQQNALICPIDAVGGTPSVVGAPVLSTVCPFDIPSTGLFQTLGLYNSRNNFFSALARTKVLPRLTAGIGYSISNNNGSQLFTNPLLVGISSGVQSSFHRPLAVLEFGVTRNLVAKAGWNYYGYNEKAGPGPTLPRDFHANNVMASIRYAF
jgi:opacity protein-like surface antigen